MSDRTIIAFLRVDLEGDDGQPESLRLHTGLGTIYPVSSKWSDYLGSGALLAISSAANESTTAASEFDVEVVIPNKFEKKVLLVSLFERILATSLENREVCIHAAELEDVAAADKPEPYLVLAGKVANVQVSADKITMRIYTAATLLNYVVGGPSRYSDITHKRFIDRSDQALQFQTDTTARETYFP